MKTFTLKEIFTYGYVKTLEHFWFLAQASACILFVTLIINSLQEVAAESSKALGALFFVLTFAVDIIVKIGYTKIYLKITNDDTETKLRDVFSHHGRFFSYCVAYVLLSLLTMVGLILFIIPGFYIITRYFFVPFIIIDKDVTVSRSFLESGQITKGNKWKIFVFLLASFVLNLAGFIAFGVGLLFTIPVTYLAATRMYKKLSTRP